MPLMPKKTKYRKQQKGRNRGKATRGNVIANGKFGLQACELGHITSNQIEAARVAMTRSASRDAKFWIRIFPDHPETAKPIGTRMGKGKGNVERWVAPVKPGRIMFEIDGCTDEVAKKALTLAGSKLSVRTKIVKKEMDGDQDEDK